MATAEEGDLRSTPMWFLYLGGSYIAGLVILGILFIAGSVLSLLAITEFYPTALSFHWLGVLGAVLGMLGAGLTDREEEAYENLAEHYSNLDPSERTVYAMTLLAIFIGMFSFLIGFLAVVLGLFVQQTGMGTIAIVAAIWYPAIDVWLGRKVGFNLASVGGFLAIGLMMVVSVAWQVSPSIPARAASDFRSSFQ